MILKEICKNLFPCKSNINTISQEKHKAAILEMLSENYIKSYNLLHYVTNYTNTTWTISWGSSSKNYPMANTHKHTHSLNYATVLEFSRNLRDVSIGWHWVCECMNN